MKKKMRKVKIVLISDVEKLGLAGDIKEVAPGFARNFLFPQGLAVNFSSPKASLILAQMEKKRKEREAEILAAKEQIKKLEGLVIEIAAKVGSKGKMFGSVTAEDIAKEVNKKSKIEIGKSQVLLEAPIKKLGEYKIKIRLAAGVETLVNLKLVEAKNGKKKK
jgi:large subunit ribosomal protein L9